MPTTRMAVDQARARGLCPAGALVAAALLLAAACGDDELGLGLGRGIFDGLPAAALACPWRLAEVFCNPQAQFVELSADPSELPLQGLPEGSTWALCAPAACLSFVPPTGTRERQVLEPTAEALPLGAHGELALYADARRVGDPAALCSYVAWGAAPEQPGSQAGAALSAGLWQPGFVPYDGQSLVSLATNLELAVQAADWGCSAPTPGAEPGAIAACTP